MDALFTETFGLILNMIGISFADGRFGSFGDILVTILLLPIIMILYIPVLLITMAAFLAIILIPIYIICHIIPLCFLFKKSGIPVWHAFVPILNDISRAKMLYNRRDYGLLVYIPIASIYFSFKAGYDSARIFGRSRTYAVFCGLGVPFLNYGLISSKRRHLGYIRIDKFL